MFELYWRLLAIVVARGRSNTNVGRYAWVATWDDGLAWDVATQGPIPTLAEIAAVTQLQIDAVKSTDRVTRRDKALWTPQITALTKALHQRLRDAGVDQVQMGDFRAVIEAEYDLLVS